MPSSTYQTVRSAILDRKIVFATYKDERRQLCPHVLGTKGGIEKCLFYQIGGGSASGLAPGGSSQNWRCLFLDQLTNVSTQDGPWQTGPNYSLPVTCVDAVDVSVPAP